jgi:hypothetical protein
VGRSLLQACWLLLLFLSATRAGENLLIPIYDPFEDVGSVLTPTIRVELEGDNSDARGDLVFSLFHRGRQVRREQEQAVLFTLKSDKPLFTPQMRWNLVVLADGERLRFEDVVMPDPLPLHALPLRLDVWIPEADFLRLARARELRCRVGRFDFTLPGEAMPWLKEMSGKL